MVKGNRRILLLALVSGTLALVAASCNGDEGSSTAPTPTAADPPPPSTDAPVAEPAPPAETTTVPADSIKVALVTDAGGVDDRGSNESSIAGLDQAVAELGVEGRVFISNSVDDYLPNLLAAATDGSDLILTVGLELAAPTIQTATDYPDIAFAGIDQLYGSPGDGTSECEANDTCVLPNALGLGFPSEEAGYLAGIVAALTSQTGTISTLGSLAAPSVDSWIAGFQQGAISADPNVKLLNDYTEDVSDEATCRELGGDQIERGSDVVFPVAGACGLGALAGAVDQGVFGIGVNSDHSAMGDHILTSALKPVEISVFDTVLSFVEGTYTGGQNVLFSVQDFPEATLLSPISELVSQEAQDAVAVAKEQLISGEIDTLASVKDVGLTE